ncbi:MAG: hypothetical protein HUJ70_00440 [Pseudobutyrivibrio sp.]|nr:hypothetical protein [Pseudobutyrivibrio sp.]MCF0186604.1 hypothetical protein [Bacteroidaceae bacterium]
MPNKNKSPDLDEFLEGRRNRYISYYEGARKYGLPYTLFMKLAKECESNMPIRKTTLVDLDIFEPYFDKLMNEPEEESEDEHGTKKR